MIRFVFYIATLILILNTSLFAEYEVVDTKVTASIKDRSDDVEGIFRFTLYEVTGEPGYCMNAGDQTEEDLDLAFSENQEGFDPPEQLEDPEKGWVIQTEEKEDSATVQIESYDRGAWAKIKAEVNISGEWEECEVKLKGQTETTMTIPLDTNENYIADQWEKDNGTWGENQSPTQDTDNDPHTSEDGDGFTTYEEYRGFEVKGEHERLNPTKKEIFIYDKNNLLTGAAKEYFLQLGLDIYLIDESEFDDTRAVNFKQSQHSTGYQKCIILEYSDRLALHEAGVAYPFPGTPNYVSKVMINPQLEEMGYERNKTVAHELAHAVGIMHHGIDKDLLPDAYKNKTNIAAWGGHWSGDVNCIMRYNPPDYYYHEGKPLFDYPESEDPATSATAFCETTDGTGINANDYAGQDPSKEYPVCGPATFGNCKNNIYLKGVRSYKEIYNYNN